MIEHFLLTGAGAATSALAYTFLRGAAGAFFAISGFNKLFNKGRHETLTNTLTHDGIPSVRFNQWFVPGVEFLAGLGVAFGFLTSLSALGLLVICLVATCVDARKRVDEWAPINVGDRVDDYLYLPEVIYLTILAFIVANGGGLFSLDTIIKAWI